MGTDEHKDKKDYAPVNPLSPHADDPAWEPGPPEDDNGVGGEYDQKPYRVRATLVDEAPETGEYDRERLRKQRDPEDK